MVLYAGARIATLERLRENRTLDEGDQSALETFLKKIYKGLGGAS